MGFLKSLKDSFVGLSTPRKIALGMIFVAFFIGMNILLAPFFGGFILGAVVVSAILAAVMGAIGLGLISAFGKFNGDEGDNQYKKVIITTLVAAAAIFLILNFTGVLPLIAIGASSAVLIFFGVASIAAFVGMYFLPKAIAQMFRDFGFDTKDMAIFTAALVAIVVLALAFAAGPFIGFLGAAMATFGGGLVGLLTLTAISVGLIVVAARLLGLAREAIELNSPLSTKETKLNAIIRRMEREERENLGKKATGLLAVLGFGEESTPTDYKGMRKKLEALVEKDESYINILADMTPNQITNMLEKYDEFGNYQSSDLSSENKETKKEEIQRLADTLVDSSQKETHEKVVARLNHLVTSGAAPLEFMSKMEPEALATLVNRHELEIFKAEDQPKKANITKENFEENLTKVVANVSKLKENEITWLENFNSLFKADSPDKSKIQEKLAIYQKVIRQYKNYYQSFKAYADKNSSEVTGEQKEQLDNLKEQLTKMEGEFSKAFDKYEKEHQKPLVDVDKLPQPKPEAVKKQPLPLYSQKAFRSTSDSTPIPTSASNPTPTATKDDKVTEELGQPSTQRQLWTQGNDPKHVINTENSDENDEEVKESEPAENKHL